MMPCPAREIHVDSFVSTVAAPRPPSTDLPNVPPGGSGTPCPHSSIKKYVSTRRMVRTGELFPEVYTVRNLVVP